MWEGNGRAPVTPVTHRRPASGSEAQPRSGEKPLARAAVVLYRRQLVSRVSPAYCPPGEADERKQDLEANPWRPHPRGLGPRDRHLRDPDRAAQARQDRGEAVRRDAAAARGLRPALRQRPAARRREDADAGVPFEGHHEGPQHDVGRARHAADQDPARAASPPTSSTCWPSAPRSTPTASCTSRPARTSSCTSSTSRTRPTCTGGWRLPASRRARRAATPSATSPPARRPASAARRRSTSRRTRTR